MREYFKGLIETLAQRIVRLAIGRAVEIITEAEHRQEVTIEIKRTELPAIEYIQ